MRPLVIGQPRRQRPPLGARIDWSHPLAKNLCFAMVANENIGPTVNNLVRPGHLGTFSGTTVPTWGAARAPEGGISFPGGGNSVGYINFGTDLQTSDLAVTGVTGAGYFSVFARVFWKGAGSAGICARSDANGSQGFQVNFTQSGSQFRLTRTESGSNMICSCTPPSANQWATVGFAVSPSLTAADTVPYVNGIAQTIVSSTNGSGASTSDAAQTFLVGRDNFSSNTSFDGYIAWLYIWRRQLGAGDALFLHNHPYDFLVDPTALTIDFGVSGAAGGSRKSKAFLGAMSGRTFSA